MTDFEPEDAFGLIRSYSRHIRFVRYALHSIADALERRSIIHDASKMLDDEFAGFTRINAATRKTPFGTPGYSDAIKKEAGSTDLHFTRNRHHPEFFKDYSDGLSPPEPMGFLDVIEMVCDWWGAGKGYDSKMKWYDSVEVNLKQKQRFLSQEQIWLVHQVARHLAELQL